MNLLNVKIASPKQLFFSGQALTVSSVNSAGKFDILPQHANFITLIQNQPILLRLPDKKTLTFNFPLSIIYATKDKVNVYTDIQLKLE